MYRKDNYNNARQFTATGDFLARRLHPLSAGGWQMQAGWRNETVLVVEDAEPIRRMVCAMLSQSGYSCLEAADGAEALDLLKKSDCSVSLVLTDVIMPKMTGAELAQQLSRIRPDIRIMFMSGYSDDPVVRKFERS